MIRFYYYKKCGTCRKAKNFLDQQQVIYKEIDITITPPPKTVLKMAANVYGVKKLFNTSGIEYKKKKLKDKIHAITVTEAIDMLSKNGRLVKRPIVFDGQQITVGFEQEEFKRSWRS